MKKIFLFLLLLCTQVFAQTTYNAIATAYVTTTISQNVVFNNTMQQGGTFTFSVLAHNGGGRAGQSDTANVKIQFYTAANALVTSVNSNYNANLPNPNAVCGNPCIDTAVPWSTLSTSVTLTGAQASSVAYAKISMYGIDGSYWAGDYGPWYRAPTFTLNGGGNLAYNPEFGPYNNVTAQGWTSSPGFGACQGAWGGSNACIVNSDGVPGSSTVGLVANANGGGPDANGGTTSGTAGGYNSTMTTTNAGTGATAGAPPPPTVTGTSVSYTSRNVVSGNTTTVYRTPVTTTTYSDGTSTNSNGTETLYQTRVTSTVVTNKIVGTTLTTISTPITKVTTGNTNTVEANGQATSTSQTVQQGLSYTVHSFDPWTYSCGFLGCIKNLFGPYAVPNMNPNAYSVDSSGVTAGGLKQPVSLVPGSLGEGTMVHYAGTITIPTSTAHPAGSVFNVKFYSQSDNGFVMNVNGSNIINDQDTTRVIVPYNGNYNGQGNIDLVAGQTYNIEAWYWNNFLGYGLYTFWDVGNGITEINNSAFTTGVIADIDVDTSGVSYSNSSVVDVSGSGPTITGTSTANSVTSSSSSTSSNTNSVSVNSTTNGGGTINSTTNSYVGTTTTTVTTTTTTPVTTTTWSDGSTTSTSGTSSSSTSTDITYSINPTVGIAPIYSATSPNTNGNSVYIKQTSAWASTQVSVTQEGNNNAVTGVQEGWAKVDGNNSIINIKQYGQGNITGVKMNAWGNNIDIKQQAANGSDVNNNILMFESYGNGNAATIQQQSNSNSAAVKMTQDINTVNITQKTGTGNASYNVITGNWNTINNTQNGSDNFSLININGDNNSATVNQTGTGHSTLLNLIGNKNTVSVVQTGTGDAYSLQQTCNNPSGCSVSVIRNK